MAHSGHGDGRRSRRLSGAKRTRSKMLVAAANDPKRSFRRDADTVPKTRLFDGLFHDPGLLRLVDQLYEFG